jgi:hypothetical protein
MLKKVLALSTCALSALAITNSLVQPAFAQRQVPITKITYARADNTSMEARLIVPDQSPTQRTSASLSPYDLHVAKMVEVTDFLCRKQPSLLRVQWQYSGNQGKKSLGAYNLSCNFARKIVNGYGLGNAVNTRLYRDNRFAEVSKIPTLNIKGDKITTWRNVTGSFKQLTEIEK